MKKTFLAVPHEVRWDEKADVFYVTLRLPLGLHSAQYPDGGELHPAHYFAGYFGAPIEITLDVADEYKVFDEARRIQMHEAVERNV